MLRSTLGNIARATPLRWYLSGLMNRMQLIQYAIDTLQARTYLEIGVDAGQCFCAVRAPMKIGVDPVAPKPAVAIELGKPAVSYFAETSDDFFARDADRVLTAGVDVAFIDGLHTYGQTFRDITNTLRFLTPGGVILVHDCLPISADEARVAETYEEAGRLNGPEWNGMWTGDAWKSIVAVRSGHAAAAQAWVLDCDHGVGVVVAANGGPPLRLALSEIEALDFADLRTDRERLLGLEPPHRLRSVVRQALGERRAS
jgi:hypothetical protein